MEKFLKELAECQQKFTDIMAMDILLKTKQSKIKKLGFSGWVKEHDKEIFLLFRKDEI